MKLDFLQRSAEGGVQESLVAAIGAVLHSNAWHKEDLL